MDTTARGWQENREEYLKKAYAAVNKEGEPLPLNQAVDNWNMLTDEASKHYFWKALGLFHLDESLEIVEEQSTNLFQIDTDVEMQSLQDLDAEDLELGEGTGVRRVEEDQHREYGDFQAPIIPTFIAWEHVDRQDYDIFPYEDPEMRGLAARNTSKDGTKQKWIGFYNTDEKTSTWLNQVFRGLEMDGKEVLSEEDIFSNRNRESYVDTIWESEPLKMRQRGYKIWDAAVEAVEEELPERVRHYRDRWDSEIDEMEALKREMRLMIGDDEFQEDGAYIERIVDAYYSEGLERDSKLLRPLLENMESTPVEEGDMNYGEATRGSATSEGLKERNQAYMEHFLDLVWQMSEEAYGEQEL